jgi:hypothetical protein
METYIHVFIRKGGELVRWDESWTPDELGGVCPAIGDTIIDPGLPAPSEKSDFATPSKRTFYKVAERYFRPEASHTQIMLVVEERLGREDEVELL